MRAARQKVRHTLQKIVPDWLGLFPWYPSKEDISSPSVCITHYDHNHDQCYLVYYTPQDKHMDIFVNETHASIVAYKISCPNAVSKPLLRHQVWVALEGKKGTLRVEMQGEALPLQVQQTIHSNLTCNMLPAMFPLPRVPFFAKKYENAWLFMDRRQKGDDNAEHLYRYIQKHNPEQLIYFALQKNCSDWARLEADHFNLVDLNSFKFKWILKYCRLLASSHMDIFIYENTYAHSTRARKKRVFLQHGVIYNDLSDWINDQSVPFDLLVTTTNDEYAIITENKSPYNHTTKTAQLLGLARHDALAPFIQKHDKKLLIMPTWRRYLHSCTDVASLSQSAYVQHWNALLQSDVLKEIATQHDLQIVFYLHQSAQNLTEVFNLPDHIVFASQDTTSIQQHFKDAALMITDYSSVFFEMAFLEKAIVYYQFDPEDFYGTHWKHGYFSFEKHGFGPIAEKLEAVLTHLRHLLSQEKIPEPYMTRMQNTFAFKDGQNCARTYKAITNLF